MLKRIVYTLKMGWRYRQHLGEISRKHTLRIQTTELQHEAIKARGIKALVLDFDGVLAAHGAIQALPDVEVWLDQSVAFWGAERLFILSNKPMRKREAYFEARFPGLRFITGVAKKPYPDGLALIASDYGFKPQELLLLDDRLLTGILASCIAGTQVLYIYPAYCDFKRHPIKESFFSSLRFLERRILRRF